MSSVNKVILVGRLGNNPEVRTMPDGNAVANISIATSETWTDKQTGEKKEIVQWHRVVLFRRLAEITGQYLTKGSLVYIEGKLKTRKWQDPQTGQDRYTTEIQAESLQMLGSKSDAQSQAVAQNGNNAQSPNQTSTVSQATAQDVEEEPVPF